MVDYCLQTMSLAMKILLHKSYTEIPIHLKFIKITENITHLISPYIKCFESP